MVACHTVLNVNYFSGFVSVSTIDYTEPAEDRCLEGAENSLESRAIDEVSFRVCTRCFLNCNICCGMYEMFDSVLGYSESQLGLSTALYRSELWRVCLYMSRLVGFA